MRRSQVLGLTLVIILGCGVSWAAQIPTTKMVAVGDATSISADGRLITFTDWNTGKIMVRDLHTGETRPLTTGGYPDYGMYAQISPDGDRVAYSWRVGGGHFDLRVVGLDGSEPNILRVGNDDGETYFVRDWSPDAKWILVRMSDRLALVSSVDGVVEPIVGIEQNLWGSWARFAPGGRTIAFGVRSNAPEASSGDIRLYSLDEGRIVASISHPAADRLIGWMPDGRWLIFSSDRGGRHGLWGTPVGNQKVGTAVKILDSLGEGSPWGIGVTGDGSAFYSVRTWENDLFIADYDSEAATLDKPRKLVSDVNYSSAPAWAPDGKSLVYSRPRTLVIRSFPEGTEREIRYGLRRFHSIQPHWSSDGTSIMLGARYEGSSAGLIAVDTNTGEVTPIIKDSNRPKTKVEWATGSPTEIAYIPFYDVGESGRIIERDMRTDNEREIFSFESHLPDGQQPVYMLALSPDGRTLAYVERSGETGKTTAIKVRTVNGGEPRELFKVTEPNVLYHPGWTPDSQSLLFGVGSTRGTDSELTLWRTAIQSRNAEQLTGLRFSGRNMGGLSVHPDGKRIIFTSGRIYPEGVGIGVEVRDEVRVVEKLAVYLRGLERL